jgi:hypothetical protein
MKKRFIVSVDNSSIEQQKVFMEYINKNNLGFWHYLANTWLLTDSRGVLACSELRDVVRDTFFNEHNLVIEISSTGDTWAGFGPKNDTENMFTWIKKNWIK